MATAGAVAQPGVGQLFFIYEHFGRFANEEHDRFGSLFCFYSAGHRRPDAVDAGTAQTVAPRWLAHAARDHTGATLNVPLFLTIWCVFIFLFFSASKSKLPSYLLPITPGCAVADAVDAGRVRPLLPALAAADRDRPDNAVPATTGPRSIYHRCVYAPGMVDAFALYIIVGGVFFALAIVAAWRLNRRGRRVDAMLLAAVLATVGGSVAASGYEVLSPSTSSKQLVQDFLAADPEYTKADPFYSVGIFEQTLQPYLGRTTILVEYLDDWVWALRPSLAKFASTTLTLQKNGNRLNVATRSPTSTSWRAWNCTGLTITWSPPICGCVIISRHARP